MFVIEITRRDYRTGETRTWRDKRKYRTLPGAQKAAQRWRGACRPPGGETISETFARVVSA